MFGKYSMPAFGEGKAFDASFTNIKSYTNWGCKTDSIERKDKHAIQNKQPGSNSATLGKLDEF